MHVTKEETLELLDAIEDLHNQVIVHSGGENGIRDKGGLEHVCYKILTDIRNNKNPIQIAAKIYELLATRHYFVDGNKRTSHIIAKSTLLLLGYHFKTPYSEAIEFIIQIADKKKEIKQIEDWIEQNSTEMTVDGKEFEKILSQELIEFKEYFNKKD